MMRPNLRVLIAIVGLVACVAVAVQQSPNFASLTTQVQMLTSDSRYPLVVTVPLPYRERQRIVREPVPADEFDVVWPNSAPSTHKRTDGETGGRP